MVDYVVGVEIPRCKKILPLVYTDSLSYYETLCSFVAKLNEVVDFVNGITDDVLDEAKAYTDIKIAETFADVDAKLREIERLIGEQKDYFDNLVAETVRTFNGLVDDLQSQYFAFTQYVNSEIRRVSNDIADTNERLDESIEGVNQRTDLMIQLNNEWLIEEIAGNLPNQLRVYNILEGDRVTIQDMFNYLCNLHITDGIDVDELVLRALTVNRIVTINRTVRDVVMYGNTILTPV